MTTSLMRTLVVATVIVLAAAACAGEPPRWTFAPVVTPEETGGPTASGEPSGSPGPEGTAAPSGTEAPASEAPAGTAPPATDGPSASEPPAPTGEPAGTAAPSGTGSPAGSPGPTGTSAPSGEARVVELEATTSLQFTTPEGERVTDIPVTPGETLLFRVDNIAGFDHNLHIGTDEELSVSNASGLPGIPTWSSGVQEFEWAVPDDVSGLKFGCTIPGHYPAGMQGTFSAAS